MTKILSVAVPCYNVEWCLEKCLNSFITAPLSAELEVIIVNDGSTDKTQDIALDFANRYPSTFKLINKENGGHGSAINTAIKEATGKYFNAVDADDWIVTKNLLDFIKILSDTYADAVMTHFNTVDMNSGKRKAYKTKDIPLNKVYTLDEFTLVRGKNYKCAVYHGLTFRTVIYRESGTILSEGVFYEDQEYATLPFKKVETILPLDLFYYEYLIGNANQSVASANQVKRLSHIEQMISNIFLCYENNTNTSDGTRRYIEQKATALLPHYYFIAMVKNPDKPGGRKAARQFREKLAAISPQLLRIADNKFKLIRLMNMLRIPAWLPKLIFRS